MCCCRLTSGDHRKVTKLAAPAGCLFPPTEHRIPGMKYRYTDWRPPSKWLRLCQRFTVPAGTNYSNFYANTCNCVLAHVSASSHLDMSALTITFLTTEWLSILTPRHVCTHHHVLNNWMTRYRRHASPRRTGVASHTLTRPLPPAQGSSPTTIFSTVHSCIFSWIP